MNGFPLIWYSAVACTVLAALAHLVAEGELRKERPHSRGLGWFGPGPHSSLGQKAYLLKRLLTVCILILASIAIALGGPP